MKKTLSLFLSLLAVVFNSCSKGDDVHFQIENSYRYLEFDARTNLTKYVYIDTNTESWDYELIYNIGESWCEIERTALNQLKITCIVNESEKSGRDAQIEFYINGKVYGAVNIHQAAFQWTKTELQLKDAQDILSEYNYMNFEIDFASLHGEYYSPKYKGIFNYTGDGLNLSIPVIFTVYQSTSFDHVYIRNDADANSEMSVYGSIYTGYESNGTTSHYVGDFEITIYGYINGEYKNIKLTN